VSKWLNTRGRPTLAIAVCDRCNRKFPWDVLQPDTNSPGLRVCPDDLDQLDPYRLPARQTETITLAWARPDVSLVSTPSGLVTEDDNLFITTEDGEGFLIP
jgi:hypothetical protein